MGVKNENDEYNELYEESRKAFRRQDYVFCFSLSTKLAEKNSPYGLATCGIILEKGKLDGIEDLEGALGFYKKLGLGLNQEEGYLGIVRVILAKHWTDERESAIKYCLGIAKNKKIAFLLLGRVYEELYTLPNYDLARKSYLKSIFLGSAWAMRRYAASLASSGNLIGSVMAHILATLLSPFFLLFGGRRAFRRG
jgi:hypothetical protein